VVGGQRLKKKTYGTIILHVLYGCETSSLMLREEHRLRVSENRVLRRIFVHNLDEVTGDWRKLHNEELHNLHCTPNIIRVIRSRRRKRWVGHVMHMGRDERCVQIFRWQS
jgi:hypothetical protein